jgi:signal transduction histidine kinase
MATFEDTRPQSTIWSTASLAPAVSDDRRSVRAQRVARQLLEHSRLTQRIEVADLQSVELFTFLNALLRDYPSATIAPHAESLWLRTDSRRLASVLFAVLDNAQLHGRAPVELRATAAAIVITDHGPGFTPQLLREATQPFRTGSRVAGRGVGLGLAIATAQMRLLSGDLSVDNAPGGGACVTLQLGAQPSRDE